jgi:hypothetical protein
VIIPELKKREIKLE